jgi:DNA-binding response OmpR family regulator
MILTKNVQVKSILVLEDNLPNLEIVTRFLRHYGYSVSPVASLEEAYPLVRHHYFDLIILDIMLPAGCGLDVLTEYKGRNNVLIISALTHWQILSLVKLYSIDSLNILEKPFSLSTLSEIVENVLFEGDNEVLPAKT